MGNGDIVIGEDLYKDEDPATYSEPEDPISAAVGAPGFVTPHTVDDCVQQLPGGWDLGPESFDRFYWEPVRILIDFLTSDTPQEQAEEREAKHCAFKTEWCAENGYRYVVLTEDLMADPFGLEDVLAGVLPPVTQEGQADTSDSSTSSEGPESEAAAAAPAPRRRAAKPRTGTGSKTRQAKPTASGKRGGSGKVQRPRA